MRHLNTKIIIPVMVFTSIFLWIIILRIRGIELMLSWEAIEKLGLVVSLEGGLFFVFRRWLWQLKLFQGWLVPFPNLQGKWQGQLKSTWKNPESGMGLAPILVEMNIVQDFSYISCSIRTGESTSKSFNADFCLDKESNTCHLIYNYANTPRAEVRNRSEIHKGTAHFEVLEDGTRLKGDYWTDRKTTGELDLKLVTRPNTIWSRVFPMNRFKSQSLHVPE